MNTAERYYINDHLDKAIVREEKNVERTLSDLATVEVTDSPYAQSKRQALGQHRGILSGLREAKSIVQGLS